jgi:hypothetical protein
MSTHKYSDFAERSARHYGYTCLCGTASKIWLLSSLNSLSRLQPHMVKILYVCDMYLCIYVCMLCLHTSKVWLLSSLNSSQNTTPHGQTFLYVRIICMHVYTLYACMCVHVIVCFKDLTMILTEKVGK